MLPFPVRAENWMVAVGAEGPSSLLDTVSLRICGFVHMSPILVFEQHEATGELEMRTRAHCLGNSNNKKPLDVTSPVGHRGIFRLNRGEKSSYLVAL